MIARMEYFVHQINRKIKETEDWEATEAVYRRIGTYDMFIPPNEEIEQV